MINTHLRPLGLYAYKAYIANEFLAKGLLRKIRWPLGITCPKCKSRSIWKMQGDYRCKQCHHHFSDISGTIFEKSHLKISQWIIIIGLWKVGVNAMGVSWAIGCSYRIARFALKKIRAAVANDPLVRSLSGEIEVDETYYGGRQKGNRGRGAKSKTAVLGLKERGGRVKTVIVPNVTSYALNAVIKKYAEDGSVIYTDGFRSYNDLRWLGYDHVPFDHSMKFVKSDVIHTQGIEGYWGNTKPATKARHRRITRESLAGYMAENDYKTNHKKFPDFISLILYKLLIFYP